MFSQVRTPKAIASWSKAVCTTEPARRCAMCSWRSGRPTRPDATIIRTIRQPHPLDDDFRGFGRAGSDSDGRPVHVRNHQAGPDHPTRTAAPSAPHINVWIVARGINIGLNTRIYFSDEEAANAADPVLNLIEQPARRSTLIAKRGERGGKTVYTFDVHLQGADETVFFDV